MTARILHGDCRDLLPTLGEASVHAIVTDPPYLLGFMGKAWDKDGDDERDSRPPAAFDPATWRAALRLLRPGGYLVAFGGTRTYHRLACAIEDAGFEIRDQLAWVYGSGFPKGTDKAKIPDGWQGFNTALKPAWEPIVLARKPMIGTLAANLAEWDCGALNIEGCRIEGAKPATVRGAGERDGWGMAAQGRIEDDGLGRWPANLVHDGSDEVLEHFPESDGQQGDLVGHSRDRVSVRVFGDMKAARDAIARGDSGSAARFFYCAKADREDRDHGVEGEKRPLNWSSGTKNPGAFQSPNTDRTARNHHPTVKPTDLMRWLVRLVTPPGGLVLDPFAGSGSTGRAAVLERFDFIGMEKEAEYVPIARARIEIVDPESFRLGAA